MSNLPQRPIEEEPEFAIIESMTTIVLVEHVNPTSAGLLVRVWRNEEELKEDYDNQDLIETAHHLYRYGEGKAGIARALGLMPRVNAVEVKTNMGGNGVVVYKDWP